MLADCKGSHKPVENLEKFPFHPVDGKLLRQEEQLTHWISSRAFRTGKFELNDYNYEKPNTEHEGDAKGSEKYTRSDMEMYHYPGKYKEKSIGERYAKIELESEQAIDHRRHGDRRGARPLCGRADHFAVFSGPPAAERFPEHRIFRRSRAPTPLARRSIGPCGQAAEQEAYYGKLRISAFEPPLPRADHHPETAHPRHPDRQGRHQGRRRQRGDRRRKTRPRSTSGSIGTARSTTNPSAPARSASRRCWSRKKWGGQFIPRVGQEAVVEFLEGDPDRPLVVGTVYNDDNKPPYDLPAKKNIAGIKSNSTKGGDGYNEFQPRRHQDVRKDPHACGEGPRGGDPPRRDHRNRRELRNPEGQPVARDDPEDGRRQSRRSSMGDQNVSIPLGSQKTDCC